MHVLAKKFIFRAFNKIVSSEKEAVYDSTYIIIDFMLIFKLLYMKPKKKSDHVLDIICPDENHSIVENGSDFGELKTVMKRYDALTLTQPMELSP